MTDRSDLGAPPESTITALVETGRFDNRDAVLREGVRLVEARENRLALDASIARGLADAGRVARASDVGDRLRAK
ncbi:type II toxin-antitoxin system ParD family antitoxin [uncultured Methylobacterium sp.]|uniref:ribbon-helix-helix domain-containing protein n=1 Tax=uncultured Methylobacterium sp. TaxID=157278 RepID=UPI0035CCA756